MGCRLGTRDRVDRRIEREKDVCTICEMQTLKSSNVSPLNALLRGLVTQVLVSLYSLQRWESRSRKYSIALHTPRRKLRRLQQDYTGPEVVLQTFPPLAVVICTWGHSKVITSSILHKHTDDPVRTTIPLFMISGKYRTTPQAGSVTLIMSPRPSTFVN